MSYRIEYSPLAIRDLDRVYAEVLEASVHYIDGLMDMVAAKGAFPKSGSPLYYESSFTGYYFVVFKAYMVFYRMDAERMYVDRVVFGRSDYMRSIFKLLNL